MTPPPVAPPSVRVLSFAGAFLLVNALFVAPSWIAPLDGERAWVALEALALVAFFAILPRRRFVAVLAAGAGIVVVVSTVLGFGDAATRLSLARSLNLYLDAHLIVSVHHLLTGAVGGALSLVVLLGAGLAAALLAVALTRLLHTLSGGSPRARSAGMIGLALAAAGAGIIHWGSDRLPAVERRIAAPALDVLTSQATSLSTMLNEREAFAAAAEDVPDGYGELPGLLRRVGEADVLLGFIESYGTSAIEDPRYAPVVRPRLEELTERAAEAGLHVASGKLTAPIQGGQSWLAHGSVLSGLWLDNQLRYDVFLTSGRETLIDDFARVGHHTVAVMPAINMAWPEGERFGYDEIYAQRNMGYRGPPLNWVTMPDQYTWSFVERMRAREDAPVFAVIGLISSHAPWTPILPVLDEWERIGDGSVFGQWKEAGDPPAELWRNTDRVREHYALAVDYALGAIIGYAKRYVDEQTLLIALGDHQPAPLITGDAAPRTVPVHVVSGDPELVEPFLEWGFVEGGRPDPGAPAPPMDAFRHWFVEAFSGRRSVHGTR